MAFGKRIEAKLGDRPLSFLYGSIPGLTQQALSNLIVRDSATSEYAVQIADRLGVSVRWLLSGSELPEPGSQSPTVRQDSPAYTVPRETDVAALVEELGKRIRETSQYTRRGVLEILGGVADDKEDLGSIGKQIQALLNASKRKAA